MPQPVTTKLLKKIECLDYEAITFDVFKSGVFTCCVLQGKVHYPMNTMSGTFRKWLFTFECKLTVDFLYFRLREVM